MKKKTTYKAKVQYLARLVIVSLSGSYLGTLQSRQMALVYKVGTLVTMSSLVPPEFRLPFGPE
jgi:hypothetical protein